MKRKLGMVVLAAAIAFGLTAWAAMQWEAVPQATAAQGPQPMSVPF